MRVQLAQQAPALLGPSDLVIITERVADVALRIGQLGKMGLVEVLDRPLPRHWQQRGRSWGGTGVIWLADSLTEGAHRKGAMEASSTGMHHPLSPRTGQRIAPLACSDDRLGQLLPHLRKPTSGHGIEEDLQARSLAVYAWLQDVSRCDAPTVSGAHDVPAGGRWQWGPRKADPTRPPSQVRMSSLAPGGMPLATAVLSGERADDGVDMPILNRLEAGLSHTGVLCVGDGTMSAWDTRVYLVGHQHGSLAPVP